MEARSMQKSEELFEIAEKVIPGGGQNSRRRSCFTEAYPILMDKAIGAHTWDVDGNEYIDWLLSFGPIVLGHRNPGVDNAVKEQMKNGFLFNLHSPMQIEFANKLIEHIPCAEMVITVMSGSETTACAVRIARIYTDREIVVHWGYHGWYDWCVNNHIGVPKAVYESLKTFRYNDLRSLEEVLDKNKNKVACIIMMPFEIVMPEPGFLEGVRELADKHKVVLIFDEIRSWPRIGLGGAQKYFGVTPDMTTISKGIANGYPISAIVGKAEIMDVSQKTTISATYFHSTLGMAAALETIRQLEDNSAIGHLEKIGRKLSEGLEELIESRNVKGAIFGIPQMPYLIFGDKEENTKILNEATMGNAAVGIAKPGAGNSKNKYELLRDLFFSETIKRGIFFHPKHHWLTCLAHTEEDVKKTLQASEEALDIALKSI